MGDTEWTLRVYRLERTFWEDWLLAWAKMMKIGKRIVTQLAQGRRPIDRSYVDEPSPGGSQHDYYAVSHTGA